MNDPIPDQMQITQADINANIDSEYYFTAADGVDGANMSGELTIACSYEDSLKLITFCVLVMKNGFSVIGSSVCFSHGHYSAEVGREVARENAIQNVWPLMAYALKEKLAEGK